MKHAIAAMMLMVTASCAVADDSGEPVASSRAAATSTHRRICAVVGPLTKGLAEAQVCARATQLGHAELCGGWTPFYPGWDGIEEPPPPVFSWHTCLQGSLSLLGVFADAVDSAVLLGARRYEGLVVPDENGHAANTVDSIYAGHGLLTLGYDPGLPVRDFFAAMVAHAETGLLAPITFPPRSYFP